MVGIVGSLAARLRAIALLMLLGGLSVLSTVAAVGWQRCSFSAATTSPTQV